MVGEHVGQLHDRHVELVAQALELLALHRHPGEAWLYVVEGHGHSFMGTAPDQGEHHRWKKGDLIVVDHFLWHQHFNDDPKEEAILLVFKAKPLFLFMHLLFQKIVEWPPDKLPPGQDDYKPPADI